MEEKKIILAESPEAATLQTVTGWVSAKGHFYGKDERLARYDGSTHRHCSECGVLVEKNGYCVPCHDKKGILKYEKMPKKKWDGEAMLYSDAADKYFYSDEELQEYLEWKGEPASSLRLIICEPLYATEIDISDVYEDSFPDNDDYTIPRELVDAFEELNSFLREEKIILSWTPSKFAADIE